jgi:hypothetical protein
MKNAHAVALGKLGGTARFRKTTQEQRTRWAALGGMARAQRHSRRQLSRWGCLGGRPAEKELRQ